LTSEVQKECPVASKIGGIRKGLGEGIVWIEEKHQPDWPDNTQPIRNPLKFKTVAPQFSSTRATAPPISIELTKKVEDFIEYAVTEVRVAFLQQSLD
jgi:hypothetical protein